MSGKICNICGYGNRELRRVEDVEVCLVCCTDAQWEAAKSTPLFWDGERRVTLLEGRREIVLQTSPAWFGWTAIDANTYDASFEGSDEDGDHWKQSEIGGGHKEQDAIDDLFDQLLEAA